MKEERYYTDLTYIGTSEAPELSPAVRRRNREIERKTEEREQKIRDNAIIMNGKTLVVLAVALSLCIASILASLYVNVQIETCREHTQELNSKIESVRYYNESMKFELDSNVDQDKIYSAAVTRLGMVRAGDNQINYYKPTNSGYTKQLKEIPEK